MASRRSGSSSPSSGEHYNSQTAGASCWSPRTWHLDDNLGLRAETLHLGSTLLANWDGLNEYARDKRPGLAVLHFVGCHATPRRSRPKPQLPDLFAPRYASMLRICRHRAPHLPASLREEPGQASVTPVPFLVLPASPDVCPMACILESRP